MMASFFAITRKEFIQIFRSKRMLVMMGIMQLFQLMMCGYIDLTTRDLPMVFVDQDRTSQSRELAQKINATKTLKIAFMTSTPQEARDLIRSGRARGAIVVPGGYGEKRAKGTPTSILAMVDGSDAMATGQALSAITGVAGGITNEVTNETVASQAVTTSSLILFNPQGKTSYFLLPGVFAVMMFNFVNLTAGAMVREREQGTLERLVMTPLSATGLMLGKVTPWAVLGFGNMLGLLLLMRWVFGLPIRGPTVLLLLGCVLYIITVLSVGLFFASKASSFQEIGPYVQLMFMAGIFLSGNIWPISSVPVVLLPVSYAHPATHMIAIVRGVSLRDANFLDLIPHFAYLVLAPALLLTLSVRRFQSSIQT